MEGLPEEDPPGSLPQQSPNPHTSVPPTPSDPFVHRVMERRASAGNMRTNTFRSATNPATIRTVTPEPPTSDGSQDDTSLGHSMGATISGPMPGPSSYEFGTISTQSSPRSIPGGGALSTSSTASGSRRQGVVFNDAFPSSFDSTSSSPPPRPPTFRPRTHTMDGAFRQQLAPAIENGRHRMGSFSSSASMSSMPVPEDLRGPPIPPLTTSVTTSAGFSSAQQSRNMDMSFQPATMKEKKSSSRTKLMKRTSRPTSPLISPPPSVDSLPLPIPTDDANKVLLMMKTLCGRMKGEIEYQNDADGPWYRGIAYIDEEKGSLMFDPGENGPFSLPIVPDLRGCRVLPIHPLEGDSQILEVSNPVMAPELLIRPLAPGEFDLWLAALLCWQQLRPPGMRLPSGRATTPTQGRPELGRRGSSTASKEGTIIKVGKVMLWDKGIATSPRAIVKRPSTRHLRSSHMSWRKVSCILQDNGEFKLITENDVTVLSIIDLSQLSRCAVQQLDKSVLDEEFCIAIFPAYASTSTQLSIFRPVYLALDTRVLFEVWFVLLRAFTVPEMYGLDAAGEEQVSEVTDLDDEYHGEIFRVEKTITLRVTEAKIRARNLEPASATQDRHGKTEQDSSIGNYLAEVVLDGEVRARTTMKTDTKNPFWRDECEFTDLPPSLPFLSVVLKRVDGLYENPTSLIQSLTFSKSANIREIPCGSVNIQLAQLERGKDHEQWHQIYDDRRQSIGTMLVKVRHEELVVLLSKEYQSVSELLHKFSTGVTGQIAGALPGSLRRLAEIFLNIFQVSGSASEWLMALVEDEIDGIGNQTAMKKPRFSRRLKSNDSLDSASDREALVRDMGKSLTGEANLLFRGNSLLTQALEFHMRRLGKEYLDEVLAFKIFEINEINPNCEVDPGKVQQGEDINQHWSQLMQFTTEVWECIVSSASRFPPELRHVLKYIRAVAEDRYGDFLRTVTYTSVSGFLFLRFICPAILNPKLFGLLPDHPRPQAQRTLTLIAKGLQALANLSTIGRKEMWMEPMNRFLNSQRQSLKDFIDSVCSIPAERTSYILPASYSTPITILGRLSPTAREGFPSLPYLVDHARNFAALVKLWTDANSSSSAAPQVFEGDLLEFNNLCIDLQQRSNTCFSKLEALRLSEAASQPTLSEAALAEAMENASLLDSLQFSHGSSSSWMDQERPPGSSGSEMDGGDRAQRERWGRDASTLRHVSGGSEMSNPGGTVRSLRNGKHARKFLSGFIRKSRNQSPDASSSPATIRGRDRDKEKGRGGFPEWHSNESMNKYQQQ